MIAFIFIAIIYGLVEMFKIFFKDHFNNYIPFFALGLGIIFALLTYIFEPNFIPVSSLISCFLFGLFCGLATIGWNQVLKHLEKEISNKKLNFCTKKSNKNRKKRKSKPNQVITLKDIEFDKQTQKH